MSASNVASNVARDVAPGVRTAPGAGLAGLDVWIEVETPEQIAFSYSIAGIGSRAAAAALDALICVGTLVAIVLLMVFAMGLLHPGDIGAGSSASWLMAVYVLLQFAVIWGYYVVFEGIWDGQTPGKRAMKLRVVRDGGFAVTFGASAVRNLLRLVDAMPIPLYLVAIITAMLNRSRKRLGDIVAGTMVIKESRVDVRAPSRAPAHPAHARVATRLSDDEYTVLERYMLRRHSLEPERRSALMAALMTRLGAQLSDDERASPAATLVRLYESERDARATGVASRSDTGARREQHAIVALGLKRWNDFAIALDRAEKYKLRRMSGEEVSALVAQYREITTDLARLQTATRGRDSDALFFVSRLVARAHNLLYRQRAQTLHEIGTYVTTTVPGEVWRSWRQIAFAAMLLFLPAVASYTAVVSDPAIAARLLPDEMLSRANTGAERERRREGYVTIPQLMRPVMASQIIANNVQVTYVTFAMGLTAGIGTVLLLVLNGVSIGSAIGLFASKGIAHLILAFVAPHGVLELTAVCIAGGGGLLIAQGMLLPGDRTRREALVENGKRAITLIAASTLFLLVAGTLEGLVSPRVWPLAWKVAVSGATAVLMLGYLSLGRRVRPATVPPAP